MLFPRLKLSLTYVAYYYVDSLGFVPNDCYYPDAVTKDS